MDDAELVRATRNGDAAAFTAIFDRHAARVHDLAMAMLRDRGAALEVVEASFLEAGLRLAGLEQEHRLAVWLLAVTRRNAALRASSAAGADRRPSLPGDDPERSHLAGLVWEAVADLPLRERTLIELDLRQGLEGEDLADALGVTVPQAQDLQGRLRDRIQRSLSGYLVARTSGGSCPGLTKVLKRWDGCFTSKDSSGIGRHLESCRACTQIRLGLPSPLALYADVLPAALPTEVRPRVLERLVLPVAVAQPVMALAAARPRLEADTSAFQRPPDAPPAGFTAPSRPPRAGPIARAEPRPQFEPVAQPAQIARAEPLPPPEPLAQPEPPPQPEPHAQPAPIPQPEPHAQPEPLAQPEPHAHSEPLAQPEPHAQPAPFPQPEPPAEPEALPPPAPVLQPAGSARPEPDPEPAPVPALAASAREPDHRPVLRILAQRDQRREARPPVRDDPVDQPSSAPAPDGAVVPAPDRSDEPSDVEGSGTESGSAAEDPQRRPTIVIRVRVPEVQETP